MDEMQDDRTSTTATPLTQVPPHLDPAVDGSQTDHDDTTHDLVEGDDDGDTWILLKLPRSLSLPDPPHATTSQPDPSLHRLAWRTRSWPKARTNARPVDADDDHNHREFISYLVSSARLGRLLLRHVGGEERERPLLLYPAGQFLRPDVAESMRVEVGGSGERSPAGSDYVPRRPEAPCGFHAFEGIGAWFDAAQDGL